MEYSNWQQLIIFLYGLIVGMGFGFVFDVLRAFRVFFYGKISVFLQDFFYFLFCALVSFVYLFILNRGQVRLFALMALTIGALGYYLTAGKFLFPFIRRLLQKIKDLFQRVCKRKKRRLPEREGRGGSAQKA